MILAPPGVPAAQAALTLLQGSELQGQGLWAWFNGAWQAILQANQVRVVDGGQVEMVHRDGFDVASAMAVLEPVAGGGHTYAAFFAAAPGGRVEAMLFFAVNEALYRQHMDAATALWTAVRFANLQPGGYPVAATPILTPQALVQAQLQVDTAYVGFGTNLGATSEQYRFDFLLLYTSGLVYKGGAGYLTLGPNALEVHNETVQRYHLGAYTIRGDEVHITWAQGGTEVVHRQGDLLSLRGGSGHALAASPQDRRPAPAGTYVPATGTADPTWITFAPDGTFRDQGVVRHAANLPFLERGLDPPTGGSGTYAFQDWTLTLRYAGGPTVDLFVFVLPDDDLRQPRQLLFNTYAYTQTP